MILDAHIENGNLKLRGSSGSSWLISASVFTEWNQIGESLFFIFASIYVIFYQKVLDTKFRQYF